MTDKEAGDVDVAAEEIVAHVKRLEDILDTRAFDKRREELRLRITGYHVRGNATLAKGCGASAHCT